MNIHLDTGWLIPIFAILYLLFLEAGFHIWRRSRKEISNWDRIPLICAAFVASLTTGAFWILQI